MDPNDDSLAFYTDKARGALNANPSLRLLRHPQALFILSFLYAAFKAEEEMALPADLAAGRLAQFLEAAPLPAEEMPTLKGPALQRAQQLLDHWCRDEVRILRRWADEEGQIWVELSPGSERAFQWIESENESRLVGTESRYGEILRRLDEILDHARPDPRMALARLEAKREALEEEIRRIKETGEVPVYSDSQIEERFKALNRLSRELLGDFRQVEQNFKSIVREIYAQQSDSPRGAILSYTLDATEALRRSPQGESFYGFWDHLIQDGGENSLLARVEELWKLLEDRNILHRDEVLRHLKTNLHQAGKKVIATNHLLSEKLNRLLTEREKKQREKTTALIREIKDLSLKAKGLFPENFSVGVEGNPEITMVVDRPLSDPPRTGGFAALPRRSEAQVPEEDLQDLVNPFMVDTDLLRRRVDGFLQTEGRTDLRRVLNAFPPEKGLSEILAYLALASRSPGGIIDPESRWDADVGDGQRVLETPEVVFHHE